MEGQAFITVIDSWGEESVYPIDRESISIGRTTDNDVVLKTNFVSRHHARIYWQGEGIYLMVDVGSANGIFMDGVRIKERRLETGDVIDIGNFKIKVTLPETGQANAEIFHSSDGQPLEVQKMSAEEGRLARSILEAHEAPLAPDQSDHPTLVAATAAGGGAAAVAAASSDAFLLFYRVGERLNNCLTLDEVLKEIVDASLDVVKAERAFLLLSNDQGELVPRARKIRHSRETTSAETISRTICYLVFNEGKAILSKEANIDPRLASQSIMNLGITSVLAVPLWEGQKVIGVLYLDSRQRSVRFHRQDMDLMMAIGFQVSQTIVRARLSEKMKFEESVRANLERYHSPEIVDHIVREVMEKRDSGLEAKEQEATILFTDIKGFTSLAESLTPPEVAQLLNNYFSAMTDIIFEHKGTLDKFIGDAIMAVFGTPIPKYDDPIRAARAAIQMRDCLSEIIANSSMKIKFETRIGLNTGRVVCGNIGSQRRMEFTVLGDAVNVASRLESACEPGRILVGEESYRRLEPYFEFNYAGERQVKGKALPLKCWWLMKERS